MINASGLYTILMNCGISLQRCEPQKTRALEYDWFNAETCSQSEFNKYCTSVLLFECYSCGRPAGGIRYVPAVIEPVAFWLLVTGTSDRVLTADSPFDQVTRQYVLWITLRLAVIGPVAFWLLVTGTSDRVLTAISPFDQVTRQYVCSELHYDCLPEILHIRYIRLPVSLFAEFVPSAVTAAVCT